jgi:hypothetical protein
MSNYYCHPGKAGGLPILFKQLFDDMHFNTTVTYNSVPLSDDENGLLIGIKDKDHPSDLAKSFQEMFLRTGLRVKQTKLVSIAPFPDFDLFIGPEEGQR